MVSVQRGSNRNKDWTCEERKHENEQKARKRETIWVIWVISWEVYLHCRLVKIEAHILRELSPTPPPLLVSWVWSSSASLWFSFVQFYWHSVRMSFLVILKFGCLLSSKHLMYPLLYHQGTLFRKISLMCHSLRVSLHFPLKCKAKCRGQPGLVAGSEPLGLEQNSALLAFS